jgi:hypothetical protein
MDHNKKDFKDPNRDDIPAGLLRQRRNLIIVSLVLAFVYYSGVKIETAELVFFGAKLTLSKPNVLNDFILLWALWSYFLIRYTQYIRFYGVMKDIYSEYQTFLRPLYVKSFNSKLSKEIPTAFELGNSFYLGNEKFSFRNGFQYIVKDYSQRDVHDAVHCANMNFFLVIKNKFYALIKLIITSRHISDYWLPYLLAVIPFIFV